MNALSNIITGILVIGLIGIFFYGSTMTANPSEII